MKMFYSRKFKALQVAAVFCGIIFGNDLAAQDIIVRKFTATRVHINKANRESARLIDNLESAFHNYEMYEIDAAAINEYLASAKRSNAVFVLEIDGNPVRMDVEAFDLRADNYVLRGFDENGIHTLTQSDIKTYRGYANGDPERGVRLTTMGNTLAGMMDTPNDKLLIEPASKYGAANRSLFVLYHPADINSDNMPACGNKGSAYADAVGMANDHSLTNSSACKVAEITVAADYSMLQVFGSEQNAEMEFLNTLNMVSELYEDPNINITYKLTEMVFETSDLNTFKTKDTDANGIMAAFASWINAGGFSKDYAVTTLWSARSMTAGFAIAGYVLDPIPNVCANKSLTSGAPNNLVKWHFVPAFGNAILQAHELGHNWGSKHNSSCADVCVMRNGPYPGSHKWSNFEYSNIANGVANAPCLKSCNVTPIADFKAGASCAGNVSFINLSTGANAWSWDFGDGTTSTERNPTHQYSSAGTYTVTLTAKMGSNEVTEQAGIEVSGNPASEVLKVGKSLSGGVVQTNVERVMYFDVKKNTLIKSVTVNSNISGFATVVIYDNNAGVVFRKQVNINSGTSKVTLNAELATGSNYYMALGKCSIGMQLYRSNSGISYPYSNNLVSITKSSASDPTGFYYYFYDWEVQELLCTPKDPGVVTGVEPEVAPGKIEIYPNPGNGLFNINLSAIEEGRVEIKVFNIYGSLVRYDVIKQEGTYPVDLTGEVSGTYLVQINANNHVSHYKLIKQ